MLYVMKLKKIKRQSKFRIYLKKDVKIIFIFIFINIH